MPAGRPKSIDNSKVFDVSKPGSSKPISTSRPVVVNRSMAVKDTVVIEPKEVEPAVSAPSLTRRVISPITVMDSNDEEQDTKRSTITVLTEPKTAKTKVEEPKTEPEPEPVAEVTDEEKAPEINKKTDGATIAGTAPTVTEETEAKQPETIAVSQESEPKPDSNSAAEDTTETSSGTEVANEEQSSDMASDEAAPVSDAASVDALAEASEKPKLDQKQAEEQAKREAELQGLIDSKKYFVPLAHDSTKSTNHNGTMLAILLVILLIAGAYLAIDAKVINTGLNLPFHIFSQ